jgi:site-specific DNA-methyltransferase (cytosine-N4-specific)
VLIRSDARNIADHVPEGTASLILTSPPYPEQRYYGTDPAEIGHERTLEAFVDELVEIFHRARPCLGPRGALFLNLGDKANGSGGAGGDWRGGGEGVRARPELGARLFRDPAYLDATFLDAPGAVLRGLLLDGWRLRAEIVWARVTSKTRAPALERGSYRHLNRPKVSHEKIFLLAPGPGPIRWLPSFLEEHGTVWHFPTGGSGDPHLAPFPDELARRCILPTTLPGDLVVDPFVGSGTTHRVALELGREAIGLDLYHGMTRRNGQALPEIETTIPDPRPIVETHTGLVTKAGTVDLGDLRRVGLKPAVLYHATRLIADGAEIEDVARKLKLTDDHRAYIDELTAGRDQ